MSGPRVAFPYPDGKPWWLPLLEDGERYAEALIEIAAAFHVLEYPGATVECAHCWESMTMGCKSACPGQIARRALGVA